MARIDGKCVVLCDFCQTGGECLEGHRTEPAYKMDPRYYWGLDVLKSGDELITAERDRQVHEFGFTTSFDLTRHRGDELQNSILSLLTGTNYQPNIWGDDHIKCAAARSQPIQMRRVVAGAILCALIDVDNLKYQILMNEQKLANDALRGDKKG
jgi:hypothetical protein